jgi:hypothetical protein
MYREPPCWSPDATSAIVLMEYLKRVSPEFVAAELEALGLLDAADEAAAKVLEEVVALPASDRAYRHAVRRLSASDVDHALCALGLEADQLDKRMSAVLRVHKITCRDDAGSHARASSGKGRLLARFVESMRPHKRVAMVTLAMCVVILAIAETGHLGAMNVLPGDGSPFMQLAGPTPEW